MIEKIYNTIICNNNELLITANEMNINFYNNNIHNLINNNYFNPDTKFNIIIDILNIYIDIKKNIIIYNDYIKRYHYQSIQETFNFSKGIDDINKLKNNIVKYINNIKITIKTFNIRKYINKKQSQLVFKYNNDSKESYKSLVTDLYKFRDSQFKLFENKTIYFYKKSDINYKYIFERLLNIYIQRVRYVEFEILKIKYGYYINIKRSLSQTKETIHTYISDCIKNDNIF